MSKATDTLTATVAGLTTSVVSVQALVQALKSMPDADDAAVLAANDKITQAKATLDGLLPPAPTPPAGLEVSPASLELVAGAAVTASLSVSGGTAPYSFDGGSTGLSIDASTGVVSGTAPADGFSGQITVTDSVGAVVSVAVTSVAAVA